MRLLLILIIAAAALWSGYWVIGSRGVESDVLAWFDERQKAGWIAENSGINTAGFPNRFDTTITELELADPASGLAWSAPFFQLLRLSYQPNHVIAVWPREFAVSTPQKRVAVTNDRARASLVFKPGTRFELDRTTVIFEQVHLQSSTGWTAEMDEGRFATRPSDATDGAIDVAFQAKGLRPANDGLRRLADTGYVPGLVQNLKIDATLKFDAPWDLTAVETSRPAITAIDLNLLQITWGKLELWAAGELTVDGAGRATGEVTVKAKNWRELYQIAVASGWIPQRIAGALKSALNLLAGLSGSPKTLDAPLTIADGEVSFGPISIGTIPPVKLR